VRRIENDPVIGSGVPATTGPSTVGVTGVNVAPASALKVSRGLSGRTV
jgi:hypothetical protein